MISHEVSYGKCGRVKIVYVARMPDGTDVIEVSHEDHESKPLQICVSKTGRSIRVFRGQMEMKVVK